MYGDQFGEFVCGYWGVKDYMKPKAKRVLEGWVFGRVGVHTVCPSLVLLL